MIELAVFIEEDSKGAPLFVSASGIERSLKRILARRSAIMQGKETKLMLHIHNGDSTAGTLREAGFPGQHFVFREALASGPTPQGLSKDEWLTVRANDLAAEPEASAIKQELTGMYATLANLSNHEEVILWFEHDLFCQINLIYLLDHFARQGTDSARLSLICIGEFPGRPNFRGLGELTAAQLASLFDTRHEVNAAELGLAQRAWEAYCSPDPHNIERLLAEDTSALPFLRGAFEQHLARFPSVGNGLGHAENKLLGFIADGISKFGSLCPAFFNAEPAYGLGDSQIWHDLKRMAEAAQPLIQLDAPADATHTAAQLQTSCSITETGRRVLAGQADFIKLNGIDLWLGGVHLRTDSVWRWDEQQQALV
jgi:hypothetical protein